MIIKKRKSLYVLIAAISFAGLTAIAQPQNSSPTPEGAWNVAVTFDRPGLPPCAPAPAVAIATHPHRGTIVADSCFASEGAGYGVWEKVGNRFAITFRGNSFAPGGTVAATYKVRASVSLDASGNVFAGPFQTQIFDLAGNVLDTLTGTVNAVRITLEP